MCKPWSSQLSGWALFQRNFGSGGGVIFQCGQTTLNSIRSKRSPGEPWLLVRRTPTWNCTGGICVLGRGLNQQVTPMATNKGSTLKDCPTRPGCPRCGMAMLTIERVEHKNGAEHCRFECLRCEHVEVSEPA
jgi:hypothetical protein